MSLKINNIGPGKKTRNILLKKRVAGGIMALPLQMTSIRMTKVQHTKLETHGGG
jgi:hypothetical protein